LQIEDCKLIFRRKGDRPIDLFEMIGRHGGQSEASYVKSNFSTFQEGVTAERALER
jgi:hypothetical protein